MNSSDNIRLAILTSALALMGTIISSGVQGCRDLELRREEATHARLAKQREFELAQIENCLKLDGEQAVAKLSFLIRMNVISSQDLRQSLQKAIALDGNGVAPIPTHDIADRQPSPEDNSTRELLAKTVGVLEWKGKGGVLARTAGFRVRENLVASAVPGISPSQIVAVNLLIGAGTLPASRFHIPSPSADGSRLAAVEIPENDNGSYLGLAEYDFDSLRGMSVSIVNPDAGAHSMGDSAIDGMSVLPGLVSTVLTGGILHYDARSYPRLQGCPLITRDKVNRSDLRVIGIHSTVENGVGKAFTIDSKSYEFLDRVAGHE